MFVANLKHENLGDGFRWQLGEILHVYVGIEVAEVEWESLDEKRKASGWMI